MLDWILLFLIIGLILSVLGATGAAGFAFGGAKILAVIFLVLIVLSFFNK